MGVNHLRHLTICSAMVAALGLALPAQTAQAQAKDEAANYPDRPIRLIVPFAPGGSNDIFARLVGQKASEILGQPMVVENRPGAGGRVAAEWVTNQPQDGYTVFVASSGGMSIAAAVYSKLAYHPTKSFVPLTMISDLPLILVVAPDHPAKSVKELIAWAKQNPDKTNYASSSVSFTLGTELLKLSSGMPATMIPYKSSGAMVLSVVSGDTTMALSSAPPVVPQVKAGKVRALAVTGDQREPELPDVPSMAEQGFPAVDIRLWTGLFVGAKTPPAITAKLEDAFRQAIKDPGVSERLRGMASVPSGNSSDEFRKLIDADIESYRKVVDGAKLKFE